jgi:hypothetical protein
MKIVAAMILIVAAVGLVVFFPDTARSAHLLGAGMMVAAAVATLMNEGG